MANYYDLSGHSTRINWYPNGKGGPIRVGASVGPVLEYSSGSIDASASGADLTVSTSPVGTFVVAVIKKSQIAPGAITSFAVLIPDVVDAPNGVSVRTIGVVSVHRGTARLGAGQLETYTELALTGTAQHIELMETA